LFSDHFDLSYQTKEMNLWGCYKKKVLLKILLAWLNFSF